MGELMRIELQTARGKARWYRVRPGLMGVGVVVEDELTGEKVITVDFQPVGCIEIWLHGNPYQVKVSP